MQHSDLEPGLYHRFPKPEPKGPIISTEWIIASSDHQNEAGVAWRGVEGVAGIFGPSRYDFMDRWLWDVYQERMPESFLSQ